MPFITRYTPIPSPGVLDQLWGHDLYPDKGCPQILYSSKILQRRQGLSVHMEHFIHTVKHFSRILQSSLHLLSRRQKKGNTNSKGWKLLRSSTDCYLKAAKPTLYLGVLTYLLNQIKSLIYMLQTETKTRAHLKSGSQRHVSRGKPLINNLTG
jgi:hypothetical protein